MKRLCLSVGLSLLGPAPLLALTFDRCDQAQMAFATAAVHGARDIALASAAAVGDTPQFARWFGRYSPAAAETVRAGMKAVDRALRNDELQLVCPALGEDGCDEGTYANVLSDQPYRVNVCAAFFTQPTMGSVTPDSRAFDSGTREGTLIHEISHFDVVAATDDNCYTRTVCSATAKTDPDLALRNADSFQYYAEDVVLSRLGRIE